MIGFVRNERKEEVLSTTLTSLILKFGGGCGVPEMNQCL